MKRQAPPAYTVYQSNLRHFRKRWNERYAQEHGEFSRVHRRLILEHIYYGESRWVNYSLTQRALLSIEAVPLNGRTVFVIYDQSHHDLFSALHPHDPQVRGYKAWERRVSKGRR